MRPSGNADILGFGVLRFEYDDKGECIGWSPRDGGIGRISSVGMPLLPLRPTFLLEELAKRNTDRQEGEDGLCSGDDGAPSVRPELSSWYSRWPECDAPPSNAAWLSVVCAMGRGVAVAR